MIDNNMRWVVHTDNNIESEGNYDNIECIEISKNSDFYVYLPVSIYLYLFIYTYLSTYIYLSRSIFSQTC